MSQFNAVTSSKERFAAWLAKSSPMSTLPDVKSNIGGAQPVPLSVIEGALVRFKAGAPVRFNAGGALETSRVGAAVMSRWGATPVKSRLGGAGVMLRPGGAEVVRLCTPVMLLVKL